MSWSGNTTSWGKFITFLCMCEFASWLWTQVHPRDMCTLPLLYAPHTNDGPFSAPSVKAHKIADDTTLASMRDGSAGCHRRVQTNKLELNVQKTIEIQVSHFHRHSPTHPLLDIVGSRLAQLLERHHSNRETCFSALCSDLNGGEGQRDRMLINKASHYYKIIGTAVRMGELLKFPRIIISNTPKILPTIQQQKSTIEGFSSQLKTRQLILIQVYRSDFISISTMSITLWFAPVFY